MNYNIIDNFLPRSEFKVVKEVLLHPKFTWNYKEYKVDNNNNLGKYSSFEHIFYEYNSPCSQEYECLSALLSKLKYKSLISIKANLYTNSKELVEYKSHVDHEFAHNGAIFYINSNDGYTHIGEDIKVESVENRLLTFDSFKPHYGTNCTNAHKRININFNYF